jgi:hypothetical protein
MRNQSPKKLNPNEFASQPNMSQRGGASTAGGLRARDLSNEKSVSKQ